MQDCFVEFSLSLGGAEGESRVLVASFWLVPAVAVASSVAAPLFDGVVRSSTHGSAPGYGGKHNSYFLARSGGTNLKTRTPAGEGTRHVRRGHQTSADKWLQNTCHCSAIVC